jgi:hypothetical protein
MRASGRLAATVPRRGLLGLGLLCLGLLCLGLGSAGLSTGCSGPVLGPVVDRSGGGSGDGTADSAATWTPVDTGSDDLGDPLHYIVDIEPLLTPTCNDGCHPGADSMASFVLGEGYGDLVDVPAVELPTMDRVEAGNPDRSYLMHKLDGTHIPVGGMGPSMPPDGALLSEADRDTVRRWIQQGAPE